MLRGIDISNWQDGLSLSVIPDVDFAIFKATGGTSFVDPCCDPWVQEAKSIGLLWGFYHFAGDFEICNAEDEARFFIDNTINYFGEGIPVLDWEVDVDCSWVNTFVRIVHEETGVWPWIYANPWRFDTGEVEENCARWIASYPNVYKPTLYYDPGEPPKTNGLVACWQYASDGQVNGYFGNLDVDHYYGDRESWLKYCSRNVIEHNDSSNTSVLENDEYRITVERR